MSKIVTTNALNSNCDSLRTETRKWTKILGPERARATAIWLIATASKEDPVICSDGEFAKYMLERMERVYEEIDTMIGIIDDSSCSDSEKQELRVMLGFLIGFCNAVNVSIFIDHPNLIPDDHWREMVEDTQKRRSIGC